MILNYKIKKYKDGAFFEEQEKVCIEKNFDIRINNTYYVSVMCLPDKLKEFIVGFLFSEDFIKTYKDVKDIEINENEIKVTLHNEVTLKPNLKRTLTTGCGHSGTGIDMQSPVSCKKINTTMRIRASNIIELMKEFNKKSNLFLLTGAVHICGLVDDGGFIAFAEDIGRHNAFDKIIGFCLINNIDITKKVLLTSGRISSEMIAKAIKSKIPIVISRSAPTDYAIDLAEKFFVTLIGFARGNRFNIYTFPERIIE